MTEDDVKRGRSFELLVKNIEQILCSCDNVIVDSPKRLLDRVSGTLREHDIVITRKEKHREHRTAVECRERSRPVGKPQIEAFEQKCKDTCVNCGVVVSNSGFTKSALKAASHYGIQCLAVDQALSGFDWLLTSNIDVVRRKVKNTHIRIITEPYASGRVEDFSLCNERGDEISLELVKRAVNNKILSRDDALGDIDGNNYCVWYKYTCSDLYLRSGGGGKALRVVNLLAHAEIEVEISSVSLSRFNYVDVGNDEDVLSGAFAPINCDGIKGKLYLTMGKDDGAVSFVPEPSPDAS